jgi:tetratricopeptide (TPR) repeat protein
MNKFLPLLVMLTLAIPVTAESNDAVSQAQALFSHGKYKDGQDLLNKALRNQSLNVLQHNQILYSLGDFNCEFVGNFDTAMMLYRQITESDLSDDHELKIQAQEKITEIEAFKTKFFEQDKLLNEITIQSHQQNQPQQTAKQVSQLKSLILRNPDYYKIAQVYFYLGLNQQNIENYRGAYTSFQKTIDYKPAIGFFLPVEARMKTVRGQWLRQRINRTAWGTAGILPVIIALTYYLSKPWKWMRPRHVIVGLGMVALWWGVFNISHIWLSSRYVVPADINADPIATPKYPSATPGSYGCEVAGYLFGYGLVGVVSLYIFALGTSRLKFRPPAFCANGIMGFLILSTITTIFYMRHCDHKSEFISHDQGIMYYAAGDMYFRVHGPEACILTNPKAFPNLSIDHASPEFKEWLLRHCKFDNPPKVESSSE